MGKRHRARHHKSKVRSNRKPRTLKEASKCTKAPEKLDVVPSRRKQKQMRENEAKIAAEAAKCVRSKPPGMSFESYLRATM